MSIVWNNNSGEIVAKQNEYEEAAQSLYLHLGYSADEELRDGAMGKFLNVRDLTRIWVSSTVLQLKFHLGIMMEIFAKSTSVEIFTASSYSPNQSV